MSNIASLTYETLLAYVLPAAIVELLFLPFLSDRLNLTWDTDSAGYLVLGFVGLSIVVGLLFDMWGHLAVTFTGWQNKNRNSIFFGKPNERSFLFRRLEALYPETSEQDKVELVYAIFNSHVPEHIYARRNWDWAFHEASRNILATSPLSFVGLVLLAIRSAWSSIMIIGVFVVTIAVIAVLYRYMSWSLKTYYGYYASVVLGYLLKQSAQGGTSDHLLGEAEK